MSSSSNENRSLPPGAGQLPDGGGNPPRRPYEKPRLESIGLHADEVLAKACKTNTQITCFLNPGILPGS